jgi:hypothetical protein
MSAGLRLQQPVIWWLVHRVHLACTAICNAMNTFFMGVIVPLSILLPLFFGFYNFRELMPPAKKILWYLLVAGLVNLLGSVLAKIMHVNNLPLLHIFTAMEFYLLLQFYQQLFFTGRVPLTFRLLPLFFLAACIINAVFFQSIYTYNSYARSLEALGIMLLGINYYAKIAANAGAGAVKASPYFWFNSGIFLYFSGAFMLFIFSNFIVTVSRQSFSVIWNMHAALVLLMYLLFTSGFIKCKK